MSQDLNVSISLKLGMKNIVNSQHSYKGTDKIKSKMRKRFIHLIPQCNTEIKSTEELDGSKDHGR